MKFKYVGLNNTDCICDVKINKEKKIVIMTEVEENEGASVTNSLKFLIPQIQKNFKINPKEYSFFEKYFDDDIYSKIYFDIDYKNNISNIDWKFAGRFNLI